MSGPVKKKRTTRGAEERSDKIWIHLPKSVVEARAGIIPSEATDANPPPDELTCEELLSWHRGLSVQLKTEEYPRERAHLILPFFKPDKPSTGRYSRQY
jgi:hypothetical protein